MRPDSRGEIKLKSADPAQHPSIAPRYLSAETDQRITVEGLHLIRRLLGTRHFAGYNDSEYLPGAAVRTDDELLAYARQYGGTVYHPTSTCRMGHDPMAVVDDQLRVHGMIGLRVVDAAIMPTVSSGNTNATVIMIAEKAVDMMLGRPALAA